MVGIGSSSPRSSLIGGGVFLDDLCEEDEEDEDEDEDDVLCFFFNFEGDWELEDEEEDDEDEEEEPWRLRRGCSDTGVVVVEGLEEEEYEIRDECEAELPNRLERWSMAWMASIREAFDSDLRDS